MRDKLDPWLMTAALAWFIAALTVLFLATLWAAHARPNDVWLVQKRLAERCEDQAPQQCEETLRRLRYVGAAGTLPCQPGSESWCAPGKGFHQPCCGEGDAYEADGVEVVGDQVWAVLSCNDPSDCQEIPGKIVRKPGEKYLVPAARVLLNYAPVNDTGHGWVWISPSATDADGRPIVFCWAAPTGL